MVTYLRNLQMQIPILLFKFSKVCDQSFSREGSGLRAQGMIILSPWAAG